MHRLQESSLLSHGSFSLTHLVRRFFAVVFAKPLLPHEQAWVAETLGDGPGLELFWAQPIPDRRHAHDVARFVAERAPERHDLVTAALLHDVGKRHSGLGALWRSVATLLRRLPIPEQSRLSLYTRHGPLGSTDLRAAGYDGIVVHFAAHHHDGSQPISPDPEGWALLLEADHKR